MTSGTLIGLVGYFILPPQPLPEAVPDEGIEKKNLIILPLKHFPYIQSHCPVLFRPTLNFRLWQPYIFPASLYRFFDCFFDIHILN